MKDLAISLHGFGLSYQERFWTGNCGVGFRTQTDEDGWFKLHGLPNLPLRPAKESRPGAHFHLSTLALSVSHDKVSFVDYGIPEPGKPLQCRPRVEVSGQVFDGLGYPATGSLGCTHPATGLIELDRRGQFRITLHPLQDQRRAILVYRQSDRSKPPSRGVLVVDFRDSKRHHTIQLQRCRWLSCRVIDPAGKPVVGAAVRWLEPRHQVQLFEEPRISTSGLIPQRTTDRNGYARLAIPSSAGEVVVERHSLLVDADLPIEHGAGLRSHAPQHARALVPAGESDTGTLQFTVSRCPRLTFRLVDEAGIVLSNAKVVVQSQIQGTPDQHCRSGAEGDVKLVQYDRRMVYQLDVQHARVGAAKVAVTGVEPKPTVVIRQSVKPASESLTETMASIRRNSNESPLVADGRLVAVDGLDYSTAKLKFVSSWSPTTPIGETTLRSDGRFHWRSDLGANPIQQHREDYQWQPPRMELLLRLPNSPDQLATFHSTNGQPVFRQPLQPINGRRIQVRFVDDDGLPLVGTRIRSFTKSGFRDYVGFRTMVATTDASGKATFLHPCDQPEPFFFDCEGFEQAEHEISPNPQALVRVRLTREPEKAQPPTRPVRIKLVGPEVDQLAGRVRVHARQPTHSLRRSRKWSFDAQETARISNFPVGNTIEVESSRLVGGYIDIFVTESVPAGDEEWEVTVPVQPAGMITGRVIKPDGTPATNLRVDLRTISIGTQQWNSNSVPRSVPLTHPEGRFAFGPIPLEDNALYRVRIIGEDNQIQGLSDPVSVTTSNRIAKVDVTLLPTQTLRGRLMDPTGLPVAGKALRR
ncbi:MAG: hypothetical protein AAGA03_17890, partial [Planctomycetota bacterium]